MLQEEILMQNTERVTLTSIKKVFAEPLKGAFAHDIFNEVKEKARNYDHPDFQQYFEFNEKTDLIEGTNNRLTLLTDIVLREKGFWIPTPYEARQLDKQGKLSNCVYRDYGLVFFNNGEPNANLAEYFYGETNERNLESPLVLPYKSLSLKEKTGEIIFSDNLKKVLSGEEARSFLSNKMSYVGNSGIRGLDRDWYGSWNAGYDALGSSNVYGRVDWYCGKPHAKF